MMLIHLDSIEQLSPHRIFLTWHILAAITLEGSRLWCKKNTYNSQAEKNGSVYKEEMTQCIKLLLYKTKV